MWKNKYIEKSEKSASSWLKIHNCLRTHGQQNIKFCTAKQAKEIYKYKNIKTKLYKNNAAIWYNKTCRMKQVTPGYITSTPDSHLASVLYQRMC
jgi:hypothetical protein